MKRRRIAILGLGLIVPVSASAQGQGDSGSIVVLEPITVTAQKREENLKDVPISITTFDRQQILDREIRDISDLTRQTPNFFQFKAGGRSHTTTLSMRGVSSANADFANPTVGVFVDGVRRGGGYDMDFFDVERVEVLRGPQGTLYGGNTLAVLSGFIVLICLCVALKPEPIQASAKLRVAPSLLKTLRRADVRRMLLVIILYRFGDAFGTAMVAPYLVDIGLSTADIGWLLGTTGVGFALAGCLAGGMLVRPLGRRHALLVFGSMQVFTGAGLLAMVVVGTKSPIILMAIIGLGHFAVSLAFIALYTIMMDLCSADQPATDFTVQACVGNLLGIVASSVSGFSVASLGYQGHFALALVLTTGGLLGVTWLLPSSSQREAVFSLLGKAPCQSTSRGTPYGSIEPGAERR